MAVAGATPGLVPNLTDNLLLVTAVAKSCRRTSTDTSSPGFNLGIFL